MITLKKIQVHIFIGLYILLVIRIMGKIKPLSILLPRINGYTKPFNET